MEILSDPTMVALLLLMGLCSGFLAGFFGIGGGTFIVPCMLLLGNDIKVAVGISILQMVFSSIYGSFINYKKGNLKGKDGLLVGLGGAIGAIFSGVIVNYAPHKLLEGVFLLLVCYAIYRFMGTKPNVSTPIIPQKYRNVFLVTCGFSVGIFAISLGIGGGFLITPLLVYFLGLNSKQTIPIALFFIIFASISGFISFASYGIVDYTQGILVGLASLVGVQFGIAILAKTDPKKHKRALLVLYLCVLFIMIGKFFHWF